MAVWPKRRCGVAPPSPRPFEAADLDGVVAIERVAFTDPWSRRSFQELLSQPHVRARVVDGPDGVAGYALASVVADEGEILNFAVAPAARGRGLGHILLDALLDMFRREGAARIFLEVRESNEAALHLYRAAGFRTRATRRGYYRNPTENAITMVLDLAALDAEKG